MKEQWTDGENDVKNELRKKDVKRVWLGLVE